MALSPACQALTAANVAKIISGQPIFQKSQRIAAYFSRNGEVDLQILIKQQTKLLKKWFMPVLKIDEKSLGFSRYDKNSSLYDRANQSILAIKSLLKEGRSLLKKNLD